MKLLRLQKVKDGKYLKNYELTYLNKKGKEKVYEIVSRNEIPDVESIGKRISGVSIVAYCKDRMLLLREFRMGVNHDVYNLCAGMIEEGESIEECIQRELYEETGLQVKKILADFEAFLCSGRFFGCQDTDCIRGGGRGVRRSHFRE